MMHRRTCRRNGTGFTLLESQFLLGLLLLLIVICIYASTAIRSAKSARSKTKIKLIILGYDQSISSSIGALIQSHLLVYYINEPMWYLKDRNIFEINRSGIKVPLRNLVKKEYDKQTNIPMPLRFLDTVFGCGLNSRNSQLVMSIGNSRHVQTLGRCVDNARHVTDSCFDEYMKICKSLPVTAVNTVRLSVAEGGKLLKTDPNIRILHVIRDPRESQLELMNVDKTTALALKCKIMQRDLTISLVLSKIYQGRIATLRYEDLAEVPWIVSANVFKFLGLSMTLDVANTLHTMTSANNSTHKASPNVIPSLSTLDWRHTISWGLTQDIQQNCAFVLKTLKYTSFKTNKELRNMTIPSRENDYDDRLVRILQ